MLLPYEENVKEVLLKMTATLYNFTAAKNKFDLSYMQIRTFYQTGLIGSKLG